MYDTINMWVSKEMVSNTDLLDTIPYNLTSIENESYNSRTEQHSINGHLGNYKVYVSDSGVSLKGSLAKFYLDNNFEILTRQDTQRAIELMSDVIGLPIAKAKINRLDLGYNFKTKYPVESYYNFLGAAQYYQRLVQPKSIYYRNNLRQLIFYNKIAEAKSKGIAIPSIYQNSPVLRYELRYMKQVSKQLKETVTAQTLYNEEFYIKVVDSLLSNYQKITKIHIPNLDFKAMKSPKDYIYYLTLLGLQSKGLNQALQEVELLRQMNTFPQKEYYSRLKRDLKKIAQNKKQNTISEHIKELDKRMLTIANNYR